MSYGFDRDETIPEGLRRNAESQVEEAVRVLEEPEHLGLVESVHDARKRCKKLRALARMARPELGDLYARTNEAFRDAARELSDVRDAQVAVETFDHLLAAAPPGVALPDLRATRGALVARREEAGERLAARPERRERALALIREGLELVLAWEVDDDFDSLAGGIAKTYRRAVKRRKDCLETPTAEAFHEWRKRVKYHWYHVRMLTDAAPGILGPWADRLHDLADLLGDDHDLAEFVGRLEADPEGFGGEESVETLTVLAARRSADLRQRALGLGARLTGERHEAVVDRLRVCWRAWKDFGDAPERTELADFAREDEPPAASLAG